MNVTFEEKIAVYITQAEYQFAAKCVSRTAMTAIQSVGDEVWIKLNMTPPNNGPLGANNPEDSVISF